MLNEITLTPLAVYGCVGLGAFLVVVPWGIIECRRRWAVKQERLWMGASYSLSSMRFQVLARAYQSGVLFKHLKPCEYPEGCPVCEEMDRRALWLDAERKEEATK